MSAIICTRCNKGFTEEEATGAQACPGCGTKSLPMAGDAFVNIRINVHELRILGIWAENWAVEADNKQLDNASHESLKETVNIICDRIRAQLPAKLNQPLTLSAEIKELEAQFPGTQLFRDGREEIP